MKPDWKVVQPSDPQYDPAHPVKYACDAYGYTDPLRPSPDGDGPSVLPDDHSLDSASTYGWTVDLVPNVRPTAPFGSRFIATKS
jgi:hypothetical protein